MKRFDRLADVEPSVLLVQAIELMEIGGLLISRCLPVQRAPDKAGAQLNFWQFSRKFLYLTISWLPFVDVVVVEKVASQSTAAVTRRFFGGAECQAKMFLCPEFPAEFPTGATEGVPLTVGVSGRCGELSNARQSALT